jgi:hypothetical protein
MPRALILEPCSFFSFIHLPNGNAFGMINAMGREIGLIAVAAGPLFFLAVATANFMIRKRDGRS